MEPTSIRAERLIRMAKANDAKLDRAALFIAKLLADNNGRVQMKYMDLVGLILNISREFEDKEEHE